MNKQEIFLLHQNGFSYAEISRRTGVCESTVGWTIRNPNAVQASGVYDWAEVQSYYDKIQRVKKTIEHFGMSNGSWHKAVKRGDIIPRTNKVLSLNELLVDNRPQTSRTHLKKRLIKSGLLIEKCFECGLGDEWNGKKIVLQLEHKNGKNKDNRLENLCLLCPNCHSQTKTFAGKNCVKSLQNKCLECDTSISKKALRCVCCANVLNRQQPSTKPKIYTNNVHIRNLNNRKVQDRPIKEELEKLLWEMPTTKIATIYQVSDKAVEKWAKAYGLSKPPRGYWAKQNMRP